MAEIINLRRARKRREREEAGLAAAVRRLSFGRTAQQRQAEERAEAEARRRLDGARIEEPRS